MKSSYNPLMSSESHSQIFFLLPQNITMASQGKAFKPKHKKITFNSKNNDNNVNRRFREDDNKKEERSSTIAFLQPEILPLDLMKKLLILRGAGDDIKKNDSIDEIIKLFYKHITPKPQRLYRQNRKGRILLKSRRKKEKQKGNDEKETFTIMESDSKPSQSNNSIESRLKPPVDGDGEKSQQLSCVNPNRKKIKLSTSSSSFDKIHIVKRKKPEVEDSKSQASKKSSQNIQSETVNDAEPKKKKKKITISWP